MEEKKAEFKDFKISPACGAVYMIIRFRGEMCMRIRNALITSKRVVENYHGKIIGLSSAVRVLEEDICKWPRNRQILVIYFDNESNATRWLNSDKNFGSKDFPTCSDTLEIVLIPVHYTADKESYTFHLQEFGNCKDWDKLHNGYVKNVAKCMDTFKIQHGAAFTTEAVGLRSPFIKKGNLVVLHRYECEKHFEDFYYSKAYEPFKQFLRRDKLCDSNLIVFTINPNLENACEYEHTT